jgi:hypothetical protein
MSTLRSRCHNFLKKGYATTAELMEFVLSERGRAADTALKDSLPLICYFATEQDRAEFVALMHAAKPNMRSKSI